MDGCKTAAAGQSSLVYPRRYPYQPALDGIRALAVCAVLAFHGGVAAMPGGFLGVDAFFVLSGFLITSLLLTEHSATGGIALLAFWARRARRLLPALLLVLVAVVVVGRWTMPAAELGALRWDTLAALAYSANWRMADRGGDYFVATGAPSPVQHTWSLGIEEQFYLLWPILLIVLLRWLPHRRIAVLSLCLSGAAISTVLAAWLYRPDALNRVYYGTDTRAMALLIGCALAALLVNGHTRADRPRGRRLLGGLALIGAVVTGLLWTTAHGWNGWLYRGGLAVAALAVAAVVAHAVVSPAGPTARALSLAPLVLIGRISYGLYLWHWPIFGWLTAERTGLTGPWLLAVRMAVTLSVASLCYVLIEQPIRHARRPWRRLPKLRMPELRMPEPRSPEPLSPEPLSPRRRSPWLRRPWLRRPWLRPAFAAVAVTATAAVSIVATTPPHRQPAGAGTQPQPQQGPTATASPSPAPTVRAGRKPGDQPRLAFLGDSVSWSLGTYLPRQPNLDVRVLSVPGCGIARLPDVRYVGSPHTNYPGCDRWDQTWRLRVEDADPDLALILLDRWELMDRKLNGRYQHVGDAEFDAYLNQELDLALSTAAIRGARVIVLTAPYTHRAERPDGGLWPEDEPARVDAWNRLLLAAARRHGAGVIDLNARACPDGQFTWNAGGMQIRSDGLHFTAEGVHSWIAPWLLPQLGV